MQSTLRRIIALACLVPLSAHAQAPSHEYRPQLILTLPRWHGAALSLVEEQHMRTADFGTVERQHGVIIAAPALAPGVVSLEMRQVVSGAGLVEHRYIPTFSTVTALAPRLELRNRVRVEVRDIAGAWSERYQERLTLARSFTVGRQAVQPYGHVALSYDTRYSTFSRREGAVGARLPLGGGTTLEPFLMRQTDTRRAIPTIVAAALTMRVAL